MKKVTMADVAKKANVSKSTVSQFLNKRYQYMGEETKRNIEEAIKELGYQPNFIARSLKQKRTSTIGIIVANIMHRLSTEVSRAIEDFCHSNEINTIVCNADDDPIKEKKYIEMLRAKQVDGLIIFPTGKNQELYKNMVDQQYPLVFMDRIVSDVKVDTVVVNNEEWASRGIQHLIDNGHERIAMIAPPLTISPRIERAEGYKKTLRKNGIDLNPHYFISTEIGAVKKELARLLAGDKPPTAIFAANDLAFLQVAEYVKEKAIQVPEELSIIVFDNIPFAHISTPTITTIAQPSFEMGKKAAELLLLQIEGEGTKPRIYAFDGDLIIRESSESKKA